MNCYDNEINLHWLSPSLSDMDIFFIQQLDVMYQLFEVFTHTVEAVQVGPQCGYK